MNKLSKVVVAFSITACALLVMPASAQNLVLNPTFNEDVQWWNPSPFGAGDAAELVWTNAYNASASGGAMAMTVITSSTDNTSVAADIHGAVQFNAFTTTTGSHLDVTAWVNIPDATPLVEVSGISNGQGGAAVALIDGAIDFTGVITPDADRVLSTGGSWVEVTAPTLELLADHQYNPYLMIRNAVGTAYFDDVEVVVGSAVNDWDIY